MGFISSYWATAQFPLLWIFHLWLQSWLHSESLFSLLLALALPLDLCVYICVIFPSLLFSGLITSHESSTTAKIWCSSSCLFAPAGWENIKTLGRMVILSLPACFFEQISHWCKQLSFYEFMLLTLRIWAFGLLFPAVAILACSFTFITVPFNSI